MPNYNHYTPQSDGSYRRSTVAENSRRPNPRPPYPGQQHPNPPPPPKEDTTKPPEHHEQESRPEPCPEPAPPPKQPHSDRSREGILSFLRGLLPRQIDAADLLVISLLLLINREECGEDDLSPLLTIALYFLL